MILKSDQNSFFVFDLDDTLYHEIDYLKSAYHSIAGEISSDQDDVLYNKLLNIYLTGGNPFKFLIEKFPKRNLSVEKLLSLYRNHYPNISLNDGVLEMLKKIKKKDGRTGIITDGRGITQRNKIHALGLEGLIDKLVISEEFGSEKPVSELYESFMEKDCERQYYYFGDNLSKDFISPKNLGWCCIGVIDNDGIHKQILDEYSTSFLPHIFINKFTEIEII
jgi:putative hydrolase of the HAD superfamily